MAFSGASPGPAKSREKLESGLGIIATDNYGLSEVMGPGVSGECLERDGMHLFEDHFLAELVDIETLEPVPLGEPGELVITPITKEAMPLLRYRTRDICRFIPEPCKCGRTCIRMTKVMGRSDDMMIIRGVNVYPSQVETALLEVEGIMPHYQLVLKKRGVMDDLEVHVEVDEKIFKDEMKELHDLEVRLSNHLKHRLQISPKVVLVEPKTFERTAGKSKRILDLRNQND